MNLSREKFERDQISAFTYARERGLKKGLKRGRAEGSHSKAIETARRMIAKNYPLDDIADITMLPISEIKKLK